MSDPRPVALVVQRYGAELVGGSEALCRAVALMLGAERPVEVITTCARDYRTWRNEYPAGVSMIDGVPVRRFPVDFERDETFNRRFSGMLAGFPLTSYPQHKAAMRALVARGTVQQQEDLIRQQGPHSTLLLDYLATHHESYSAIFFFTYLYSTTYFGSRVAPAHKVILAPTAHDEVAIFLPVFQQMFARIGAFAFLTPEERRFVTQTFPIAGAYQATIGMPVSLAAAPDEAAFRGKYRIDGPYLLYAGRIDPSKGCDALFEYYRQSRKQGVHDLPLVLIGDRVMNIPSSRHIRYLGRVSEEDKVSAMSAATLVINPSPFESFSITTLEAMLCDTPVLVNGESEVLKGHVERSSAGLYYAGCGEFIEALRLLLGNRGLLERMGANGRAYVAQNYSARLIQERYLRFLETVGSRIATHAIRT
jgi:glycosyltransferase involved in cell wall biosynthesis